MSGIKTMDFDHIKEEDLKDGSLLNSLIHEFLKDHSKETALYIFAVLRVSTLIAPVVIDEGEEVNDILQSGEEFYLPLFSSKAVMAGTYGEDAKQMELSIYDAMEMVNHGNGSLDGIVINAFSEPFMLPRDMFDMLEQK